MTSSCRRLATIPHKSKLSLKVMHHPARTPDSRRCFCTRALLFIYLTSNTTLSNSKCGYHMQHYPCSSVSYEPLQRSSVTSCIMEAYVSVCCLGQVPLQCSLGSFLFLLYSSSDVWVLWVVIPQR